MKYVLWVALLPMLPLVIPAAFAAPAASSVATVRLAVPVLKASGIAVQPLKATQYVQQVNGIATVLDPQLLITLSSQLAAAHAAVISTKEQVAATAADSARLQTLYKHHKYVSQHDEQAAMATAASAKAQHDTATATYMGDLAAAQTEWGVALTDLANKGPSAFANYAGGQRVLLSVALPVGTMGISKREINIRSAAGETISATYIDEAPRADAIVQGPTFFYWAAAGNLRSGQRLSASVPIGTAARRGITIPGAAVIWYEGQPWVYMETDPGTFVRKRVSAKTQSGSGWFQSSGFHSGERIVTQGAELLLSQELKPPPSAKPVSGDGDDD